MTQIEKIKKEIERLYAKTSIGLNEYTMGYENGKAEVCRLLLGFIYSLPAELVSEDLELASERYACKFSSSKYGHDKVKDAVVWGANWQKEQMLKAAVECKVLENDADNGDSALVYIDGKQLYPDQRVKLIIVKEN